MFRVVALANPGPRVKIKLGEKKEEAWVRQSSIVKLEKGSQEASGEPKPSPEDRQDTNQCLYVSETNVSLGNMATKFSVIYAVPYYDI